MNDATPLRPNLVADTAPLTPAGLQDTAMLARRRRIMAALVLGTIAGLAAGVAFVLGSDGWSWLDIGIAITFLFAAPWTVIGFWNAAIGLLLLHGVRAPLARVAPFMTPPPSGPLALRTAILMTLRNEDPARAFHRLDIVRASLEATGEGGRFDYFVLSDTSDPGIAAREEALFAAWQSGFSDAPRTAYRRRVRNTGFKAGNIRDFLEEQGDGYDLFLPLDADSLMPGREIVKLVAIMQAHPRIGILQSLVTGTPSASAFARIFQFGMRHAMRSYTIGHAWWNGDCGPYWGHNAVVRVAPFKTCCKLPELPGKPPLGGSVLSHDLIEATLMRGAGYEVRVVPVEGESWEDNPPTLLDFTQRDLRWCQGNMQYWRLLGLPGILPLSRFHIATAILMYLGAFSWTLMIALSALKVFDAPMSAAQISAGMAIIAFSFFMSIAPKLAGMLDVALTPGGLRRYGGGVRFAAGALTEIGFSMLLAPVAAVRITIFMVSLALGRSVVWSGQERDARRLSWTTAVRGLWPQTLFGLALTGLLAWKAPDALAWASPLLTGLVLSVPFAVLTASPAAGRIAARLGLCAIPEEVDMPPELAALSASEPHGAPTGEPAPARRRPARGPSTCRDIA